MTLENCIERLKLADMLLHDELKINCIKFIILNIVSFFAEGSKLNEKLLGLPIYLVKDLENFLKLRDTNKFLWLDMDYFILQLEYQNYEQNGKKEEDKIT